MLTGCDQLSAGCMIVILAWWVLGARLPPCFGQDLDAVRASLLRHGAARKSHQAIYRKEKAVTLTSIEYVPRFLGYTRVCYMVELLSNLNTLKYARNYLDHL